MEIAEYWWKRYGKDSDYYANNCGDSRWGVFDVKERGDVMEIVMMDPNGDCTTEWLDRTPMGWEWMPLPTF